MQTTRRSIMDDNIIHPKKTENEVEDAAIHNNERRPYISPHPIVRPKCHGQCFCQKLSLKEGVKNQNRMGQGPKNRFLQESIDFDRGGHFLLHKVHHHPRSTLRSPRSSLMTSSQDRLRPHCLYGLHAQSTFRLPEFVIDPDDVLRCFFSSTFFRM